MKIVKDVPPGGTKDLRDADPTTLHLVSAQTTFLTPGPPLDLSATCPAPGVLVVRVTGELDLLTAPLLDQCLQEQLAEGPAHLVVDLETVDFLACAGITTLLTARERAQAAGSALHLTGMTTQAVVRPLDVTGLLPLFHRYPTLTTALSELTREQDEPGSTDQSLPDTANTGGEQPGLHPASPRRP